MANKAKPNLTHMKNYFNVLKKIKTSKGKNKSAALRELDALRERFIASGEKCIEREGMRFRVVKRKGIRGKHCVYAERTAA